MESESEHHGEPTSPDAVKDLENQRLLLERENEERKEKLRRLKEEEKAAKVALEKGSFMLVKFQWMIMSVWFSYVIDTLQSVDLDNFLIAISLYIDVTHPKVFLRFLSCR